MSSNIKITLLAAVLVLIGLGSILFYANRRSSAPVAETMETNILKVGKADAIVIRNQGKTVVIDCGEEDDGAEVALWLAQNGISTIDLLIITHFDKDHVGGADIVLEEIDAAEVLLPAYEGLRTEYTNFMDVLKTRGITPKLLTEDYRTTIGDMELLVEPPRSYEIENPDQEFDNDFSLVTTITHGENVFLFAGDIEKKRIREWLAEDKDRTADFLKVPHHGVYNSAMEDFVRAVIPRFAVCCTSDKNPAETDILELLKSVGARTYETRNGDISVTSDGTSLQVRQ